MSSNRTETTKPTGLTWDETGRWLASDKSFLDAMGAALLLEVKPEWWGSVGTGGDDTAAWRAFRLAAMGFRSVVSPGNYSLDGNTTSYNEFLIGGTLPTINRLLLMPGSGLYALGDSITAGSGASSSAHKWAEILASRLGVNLVNLGITGKATYIATTQAFSNIPPFGNHSGVTWMATHNEAYRNGAAAATISKVKGELRSVLSHVFAKTSVAANDATVTASSGWTAGGSGIFKANLSLGQAGRYSYTEGNTLGFDFVGDSLVVRCINSDGIIEHVGTFSVAVDGVTLETYNGEGKADGISDGTYDNRLTHEARIYTGLGSGSHSVVITVISTTGATRPVYIDTFDTLAAPGDCGPVFLGLTPWPDTAGFSLGGGIWSPAAMAAMDVAIEETAQEFFNYPVATVPVMSYFDPNSGEVVGDNEHPNDIGHRHLADAFMSRANPPTPVSGGSPQNLLLNASFRINQRVYVSGAATAGANQYTVDRWLVVTSGQNVSWTVGDGVDYTITAPAGGVEQVVEDVNIAGGTYILSWEGTATAAVNGVAVVSGQSFTLPAGTAATIKFSSGTILRPQLERGDRVSPFLRRMAAADLVECQRYYWEFAGEMLNHDFTAGAGGIDSTAYIATKVTMRAIPSVTLPAATASGNVDGAYPAVSLVSVDGFTIAYRSAGVGYTYAVFGGRVKVDAELAP
jgi:hypothetical protein